MLYCFYFSDTEAFEACFRLLHDDDDDDDDKRLDVRTSKPAKATTTRAKRKLFTTTIPFDFNTISVSGQIYRATTIPDASTITISASKIKP